MLRLELRRAPSRTEWRLAASAEEEGQPGRRILRGITDEAVGPYESYGRRLNQDGWVCETSEHDFTAPADVIAAGGCNLFLYWYKVMALVSVVAELLLKPYKHYLWWKTNDSKTKLGLYLDVAFFFVSCALFLRQSMIGSDCVSGGGSTSVAVVFLLDVTGTSASTVHEILTDPPGWAADKVVEMFTFVEDLAKVIPAGANKAQQLRASSAWNKD